LKVPVIRPGVIPPDHVAPDSLKGIPRQQTKPSRWNGRDWDQFSNAVSDHGISLKENRAVCSLYSSDSGGMAYGMPHGVVVARSTEDVAVIMKEAQKYSVPVKVRGGSLTTEGETVAFGGLQIDMTGMSDVLDIDHKKMTVRTQAGIYWHSLAEVLRRDGYDYLSAPLNMTSSVGGTLSVGGIDINSQRLGCSADQAVALKLVTPKGEIVECSETVNSDLFDRNLLGYGQFGIITEATLRIRKFTPITMHYFYYSSLASAISDMMMLAENDASDYIGILTIMDRAVNLLVAFDSAEREKKFFSRWRDRIKGYGELGFGIKMAFHYTLRPWRIKEALYLLDRKRSLMPEFNPAHHMRGDSIVDRTVVFSKAVWKFWGNRHMVIPDLATNREKFIEAVRRGNEVCKKYFSHYTLYCVGIKLLGNKDRYEMSCIPPDSEGIAYGCEFEPMIGDRYYSHDYLQSFKNEIYDIGVDMQSSYYRFGGMMKGYIRRVFGDEVVDKHLALKRKADPAMILNSDVIF
jgi:FAD/FMN-containing dehydrogenase